MREVRCVLCGAVEASPANNWSGGLGTGGLSPFVAVRVEVSGEPDHTGYLCNIQLLDALVRSQVEPALRRLAAATGPAGSVAAYVPDLLPPLAAGLPAGVALRAFELQVTPFVRYRAEPGDDPMVEVSQQFEFAAAHRLHLPGWTDEQNAEVFGKCANPAGHGHNYLLEVTVAGRPDARTGLVIGEAAFAHVVNERVIRRLDHRHLNVDCPEFADRNPSVENIAQVIWDWLAGALTGARLVRVRVWETAKTYAEVTADD